MPTHRGLSLSLVTQPAYCTLPEIEHPETSQFTKRSPESKQSAALPSSTAESKADKILGRQSTVSVYVGSIPGVRFWIRIELLEALSNTTPYLYCKLLMNGRHITSCGYPAHEPASFQVMKGFFDPSEEWNYTDEKGIPMKRNGLERRAFRFVDEIHKSILEEGGVIEVQFFRAKGRQQRMQDPPEFKNQKLYGLDICSGGLEEFPQDAKYYNWHLKDPKDKPYVVFKYYYRSWDSLAELGIVPLNRSHQLISQTPSLMSLAGLTRQAQYELDEDRFREFEISNARTRRLPLDFDEEIAEGEEDESTLKDILAGDEIEDEKVSVYDDDFIFSSDIEVEDDIAINRDSYTGQEDIGGISCEHPLADSKEDDDHGNSMYDVERPKARPLRASASLDDRPPTPYSHEYGPNDNIEIQDQNSAATREPFSQKKKTPLQFFKRPLPVVPGIPLRSSSLRKSWLLSPVAERSDSVPGAVRVESNGSTGTTTVPRTIESTHTIRGSPQKMNGTRIINKVTDLKSSNGAMRATDNRNSRRASFTSSEPYVAIPVPETESYENTRVFPLLDVSHTKLPPHSRLQEATMLKEEYPEFKHLKVSLPIEQYPIGTAISPYNLDPQEEAEAHHSVVLPPPPSFFRLHGHDTDPLKKNSRVASLDVSETDPHAQGTVLSPISERSTTASPFTNFNLPGPTLRDRRLAAQHLRITAPRNRPVHTEVIQVSLPVTPGSPKSQSSNGSDRNHLYDEEITYDNYGRELRRHKKYLDLKCTPPT